MGWGEDFGDRQGWEWGNLPVTAQHHQSHSGTAKTHTTGTAHDQEMIWGLLATALLKL